MNGGPVKSWELIKANLVGKEGKVGRRKDMQEEYNKTVRVQR
jgi:hypothetical protein